MALLTDIVLILLLITPEPQGMKRITLSSGEEKVLFYYGEDGTLNINGPAEFILTFRVGLRKEKSHQMNVILFIDGSKNTITIPPLNASSWTVEGRELNVSVPYTYKVELGSGNHLINIKMPKGVFVKFEVMELAQKRREPEMKGEGRISVDAEISVGTVYDTLLSSSQFYTGMCGDVKGRVTSPLSLMLIGCFDIYRQGYLYWNSVPPPGQTEISFFTEKRLLIEGLMELIAKIDRTYEFFFPLGYAYFRFWNGAFDNDYQGPVCGVGFRIRRNLHLIEINPAKFSVGVGGNEVASLSGKVRFGINYSLIYKRKLTSLSLFLGFEGESAFYEVGERHYEKFSFGISF